MRTVFAFIHSLKGATSDLWVDAEAFRLFLDGFFILSKAPNNQISSSASYHVVVPNQRRTL